MALKILSTCAAISVFPIAANACEYTGDSGIPDVQVIMERLSDSYGDLPELATINPVNTPKGPANSLWFIPYQSDSDKEIVLIRQVSESLVQAHLQHSVQVATEPDENGSMQLYVLGGGIYEYEILIGEPCSAIISSMKLVQELEANPGWDQVPTRFTMFQQLLLSEKDWCSKFGVCS